MKIKSKAAHLKQYILFINVQEQMYIITTHGMLEGENIVQSYKLHNNDKE